MSDSALPCDAIGVMSWQTLAPVLLDAFALPSQASVAAVDVVGAGDPEATRTVYTTIVLLALLGIVLFVLAIWVFRRTRPEPELLAPLETMQTRGWRKLEPAAQRRLLDDARPIGAVPLRREASPPAVDSSFATVAPVSSFEDLSERASESAVADASTSDPEEADEQADDSVAADPDDATEPTELDRDGFPDIEVGDADAPDADVDEADEEGERVGGDAVDDSDGAPLGIEDDDDTGEIVDDVDVDAADVPLELPVVDGHAEAGGAAGTSGSDDEAEPASVAEPIERLHEPPVVRSIDPLLRPQSPLPGKQS